MVCTETVWAAAAQDPKPRLLVVDEVWSHHAAPRGRRLHGELWRSAPASTGWGCSSSPRTCRTFSSEDTSRTITGHSGRALLQNAAFKLLLQQDAAAISTVGDAFDLPEDLQRWLLSCPQWETACCWQEASDSRSASRPPRRRRQSSSGDPDAIRETPLEKGLAPMKLNTKDLLFGTNREEKKPVLLAVTPPRAGERTLLGRREPAPVHRRA